MAITLGSNIASLQAQRQLFKTDEKLSSVFERLSSGQRINRASDDAAGLAISESLNTDRRVFNQAIRNLNDGLSVLNIADSTVAELSGIVIRIQELAEQAANGSLSSTQRKSLDAEAQELKDEFFRVSRSADFNGLRLFDGSIEDGVRLQAGYGTDGSIFSSLGGEMGDGSFEDGSVNQSGYGTSDVAASDLNGDGILDLVSANTASGDVSILLGNGDGTFQNDQTLFAGSGPQTVSIGDLNGDAQSDIVVGNSYSNDFSVFLARGDGAFSSSQTFSGGDSPNDVHLADFNGDGILDLASANSSSNDVTILLGNGDGTFGEMQSFSAQIGTRALSIADVNGDGVMDIAASNYNSDSISLFIGAGNGTFELVSQLEVGWRPTGLDFGDIDQDGLIDLVSTNHGSFSKLLGNGDGTFKAAITLVDSESRSGSLILSDLDSNGTLDILTANFSSNNTTASLGDGTGSFGSSTIVGNSFEPSTAIAGDFNGDGIVDIGTAAFAQGVLIYTANTREGIAPILDFSLETQADALQALAPLERKLQSLSEQRGTIGAFQSRLQSALNTLTATSENYAAAESRIKDADIAFESSQLTRLNILQQAASAVLGQANQQPALALQLLS